MKSYKFTIDISIGLNIVLVLFLVLTRETYPIIVAFLLLVTKGALLLKYNGMGGE